MSSHAIHGDKSLLMQQQLTCKWHLAYRTYLLSVSATNWLWKNYCNVQFTFRCEWSSLLWKDSGKQASPFLGPLLPEWTRDWTKKQTKHSDTNTEPYFKWNLCILFWCAKEQIHYVNTKKAFMAFIKYFSSIPANLKLHNRGLHTLFID